jgi:hypothetical protein
LNSKFILTEQFRQYTGKDPVPVEVKGGALFDYPMRAKLAIASNILPHVTSSSAIQSRLLIVPVEQLEKSKRTTSFEDDLVREFGAFLYQCKKCASEIIVQGQDDFDIDEDSESYKLMNRANYEAEVELEAFFEANFEISESSAPETWVSGAAILECLSGSSLGRSNYGREEFIKFLKNRHNIDAVRVGNSWRYEKLVRKNKDTHPI